MKINFFSSLTKNKKNNLLIPDSILVKNLKSLSIRNGYKILENVTIFHHSNKIDIPLMIIDPQRGIYIFQLKDWSYNDLGSYELKKSHNNEQSKNTLAYDKINSFINLKFNEILHNDCMKIFNYLLTENLSFSDYEHLEDDKKKLLPYDKIIFNDTDEIYIIKKLNASTDIDESLPDINFILANLFTQYLILEDETILLSSDEQIGFIDDLLKYDDNQDIISLNGLAVSGKTTSIILKSILLKLKNKDTSVTIIEPTTLSCDIVKQSILELIEYSIINVDITSINVLTPDEFLKSKISSYIFCDDSFLIEEKLLNKIISKSRKSKLTLVNPINTYKCYYKLTKSFHKIADAKFIQNDSYKNAKKLILKHTQKDSSKKILYISQNKDNGDLKEELLTSTKNKIMQLDGSKNLIDHNQSSITLSDYKNMNALKSDIVILLDVCKITQEELSYAINLAKEKVFILYEDECQSIQTLKKIFNKD